MTAKRMSQFRKVSKAYRNLRRQVKNNQIIFMLFKGASLKQVINVLQTISVKRIRIQLEKYEST